MRLEAMQQMLQFPPGDFPQCENWSHVRVALGECIMDNCCALAVSETLLETTTVFFLIHVVTNMDVVM